MICSLACISACARFCRRSAKCAFIMYVIQTMLHTKPWLTSVWVLRLTAKRTLLLLRFGVGAFLPSMRRTGPTSGHQVEDE